MDAVDDRLALLSERQQREGEHQREEQDGQHVALGEGAHSVLGDHHRFVRHIPDVHKEMRTESLLAAIGVGADHVHMGGFLLKKINY